MNYFKLLYIDHVMILPQLLQSDNHNNFYNIINNLNDYWNKMTNLDDNDIYSAENANDVHAASLSKLERICAMISDRVGTARALVIVAIIQILWVGIGQLTGLDPYPFAFLLTISNMVQLSLIFVLALGQRQSTMHAKIRANLDHKSITNILSALKIQNKLLNDQKINNKL